MKKDVDVSKLRKAMKYAEDVLADYESQGKRNKTHRKITEALNSAYALLMKENYLQKEIDQHEEKIWRIFEEKNNILISSILIFGLVCAVTMIFSIHQTYTFFHHHWDKIENEELNYKNAKLVRVNYKENNIVNLEGQVPLSDEDGLLNPAQEFEIYNNGDLIPRTDYIITYYVDILELTPDGKDKLDKKYIKYQLIMTDKYGNEKKSEIKTFADLKKNSDGSYRLTQNTQSKNGKNKYKMIIWVNAIAGNDQQNKSYMFCFDVNAVIKRA